KKEMKNENNSNDKEKNVIAIFASVFGGIALAFSSTFWVQSTSVEVYSLQIFLFSLIIFLILRAYFSTDGKIINWMWVALSLAFGFANHMTTLFLFPFITILFFQKEKIKVESFRKILLMLALFIPVLILFYLYLPLRASTNPQINWGNPINFENFFRHISGKQYQVWLFASFEAAGKQFKYFLSDFPSEFSYVGLIIGIVGCVAAYRDFRIIFYSLIVTFLFAVLYSINYDIVDIDSYFLLAYMMFAFLIVFGFYKILIYLNSKWNFRIAVIVALLFSLFPIAFNFSEVNQSNDYTFEDYARAILNSTEKNSVIFTYQWDYLVSASYYFQSVENYRSDVTVIDKELLRRSWYYNQLKRNHPNVIKNLGSDISNFLDAVKPFERSEIFDSNLIEKYYRAIMMDLISKNIGTRNYYIGLELFQNEMQRGEFSLPQGYQIVPHLLTFKVVKGNEYIPAPDPNFTIRFPEHRNKYIDFIETTAGTMLTYRAAYELQFNKPERAKVYIEKVKKDFPNYQIPYDIENRIK
ncbi:MAG: protein O-mannosyl-transferase family, partial [Melioribacteraceae bacterium]